MENERIEIEKMISLDPILSELSAYKEVFWLNERSSEKTPLPFSLSDIQDAEKRLARFAPYIAKAFPETSNQQGIIESELVEIPKMKDVLCSMFGHFDGSLYLKCDHNLPVSGSIKARGGIYEVLKYAEEIAFNEGLLCCDDDYSILCEERFLRLFSKYSVAVGSTGNLGLSIGIISAKLGFQVTVHMSSDARQWKKDLLRSKGVTVVEYPDDYQVAVAQGRKEALSNPMCHFVDDEGSEDLFLGYSVAAIRLAAQLEAAHIVVDEAHPLFVYLPCGVGGAPGGVTFGLKMLFGSNVHVFFAEPTHAPCMLLGLSTGLYDKISCKDLNIDGITEADGLAVGRSSRLVGSIMDTLLDGAFTVSDEKLYPILSGLADSENIFVEPSSCASFPGPAHVASASQYLISKDLEKSMPSSTHLLWSTGGRMVPTDEMQAYYKKGKLTWQSLK